MPSSAPGAGIDIFRGRWYNDRVVSALVVELADTPDLGSGPKGCRFKSCQVHFPLYNNMFFTDFACKKAAGTLNIPTALIHLAMHLNPRLQDQK